MLVIRLIVMGKQVMFFKNIAFIAVILSIFTSCVTKRSSTPLDRLEGNVYIEYINPYNTVVIGTTLSAIYTGEEPVSYQWRRNGYIISGATHNTFVAYRSGHYTVSVRLEGYSSKTSSSIRAVSPYLAPVYVYYSPPIHHHNPRPLPPPPGRYTPPPPEQPPISNPANNDRSPGQGNQDNRGNQRQREQEEEQERQRRQQDNQRQQRQREQEEEQERQRRQQDNQRQQQRQREQEEEQERQRRQQSNQNNQGQQQRQQSNQGNQNNQGQQGNQGNQGNQNNQRSLR